MQATAEHRATGRRGPGANDGFRAVVNGTNSAGGGRVPPNNPAAERCLLGAMLVSEAGATAVETAMAALAPDDFYTPAHRTFATAIYAVALRGATVDLVTTADQLRRTGEWVNEMGPDLMAMIHEVPAIRNAPEYASIVKGCARQRQLRSVAASLDDAAQEGNDEAIARALEAAQDVAAGGRPEMLVEDLDEFLNEAEDEYDWVVPGLLERGDRIILTGSEGRGKSMLLRQISVTASAGVDPFTLEAIEPVRVVLVDLENSRSHVRRSLRPLRLKAGPALAGTFGLICRPEGINLLDPVNVVSLERAIARWKPDLLCIGPLYKLANGDPIKEEVASAVAFCLDGIRARLGCAVILEAHSPHPNGKEARVERPYGASLWLRWPELGLHLADNDQLRHWRGDRDVRSWPAALARGGQWPFRPVEPPPPPPEPPTCADGIRAILHARRGQMLSRNELVAAMRAADHHFRDSHVTEMAETLVEQGAICAKSGPRKSRLYFVGMDMEEEF